MVSHNQPGTCIINNDQHNIAMGIKTVFTIKECEFQLLLKYLIRLLFRDESFGDIKISKWPTLLPVYSKKCRFDHKGVGISTFGEISY